jgi:hypothetical protein
VLPARQGANRGWTFSRRVATSIDAMTFRFFTPARLGPAPVIDALSAAPELLAATLALMRSADQDLLTFHFLDLVSSALLTPSGRLYSRPPSAVGRAGPAYAALREVASRGGELLGDLGRDTVAGAVGWEGGQRPERPDHWATDLVQDLPPASRVGTRIALLAAFAPESIGYGDVGLWRLFHPGDADLVRLVAFGAITATDHVARASDPAHH